MDDVSKELIPALQLFLPGFLATTIFYWFAEVPKTSQFERVIQALICTTFINLAMKPIEFFALWLGEFYSLGHWTNITSSIYSIGIAIVVGLALANACNHDRIFSRARKWGITTKASMSESIHLFKAYGGDGVVIQMLDGRRLMGYIVAFPTSESSGIFLIEEPHWLLDGQPIPERIKGIGSLLINSSNIRWVEFLKGAKP